MKRSLALAAGLALAVYWLEAQPSDLERAEQLYTEGRASAAAGTPASLQQAVDRYQQAVDLFTAAKTPAREADAAFALATTHNALQNIEKALENYARALKLYRTLGDKPKQGSTLHALAEIFFYAAQYATAANLYEQIAAIQHEANDAAAESRTLQNLGLTYRMLEDYPKAIATLERALTLDRQRQDQLAEARDLSGLGFTYHFSNNFEQAVKYFNDAIALFRKLGDRAGEADALRKLGLSQNARIQRQPAIESLTQAVTIYRELKNTANEADTLMNLASAIEPLDAEKAAAFDEMALALYRADKERRGEALALNNCGAIYWGLGHSEKAITYYRESLVIRRELKDRIGEGNVLTNLGTSHQTLSRYEEAISFYQDALAIYRDLGAQVGAAGVLNSLGSAYDALNQHDRALEQFQEALKIYRDAKRREDEATVLNNIGSSLHAQGKYEAAIGYYQQTLAIARELKLGIAEARVLNNLGSANEALGRRKEAAGLFEQVVDLSRRLKDRRAEAIAMNNLASLLQLSGEMDKAGPLLQRSLAIFRELADANAEAITLSNLMSLATAQKQNRLAVFYGKQAVNAFQQIRGGIRGLSDDLRQSFVNGNIGTYRMLAGLLIAQGRLPEAQQTLSLLKEEEYLAFVRRDAAQAGAAGRADLTPEEAAWEKRYAEVARELTAIGSQRSQLMKQGNLTAEEQRKLDSLESDLMAGNQHFQKFLEELDAQFRDKARMSDRLRQVRDAEALKANLSELPAGTVAIYTLAGEDKYRAVLFTSDAEKSYEYSINGADLGRAVLRFRQVLQNPSLDPRPIGRELYKILIGDEMARDLDQAKATTIMLSLDGVLRYVPFSALYDGNRYLIERYRMTVFTPASAWQMKDPPHTSWTAAGFGLTKEYENFKALPAVAAELKSIITAPGSQGFMAGDVLLDDQFRKESILTAFRKYPVIHIASHFNFQPGNETNSFLLMGDGSHLTVAEMNRFPSMPNVELLTLSACNTGMGGSATEDGKEVEGLGVLAQRKGAKAVLASLWEVADASTSLLMQEFYRSRQSQPGIHKVDALRNAQLAMLKGTLKVEPTEPGVDRGVQAKPKTPDTTAPAFQAVPNAPYAHPYFWAPFFLMGNWL